MSRLQEKACAAERWICVYESRCFVVGFVFCVSFFLHSTSMGTALSVFREIKILTKF